MLLREKPPAFSLIGKTSWLSRVKAVATAQVIPVKRLHNHFVEQFFLSEQFDADLWLSSFSLDECHRAGPGESRPSSRHRWRALQATQGAHSS